MTEIAPSGGTGEHVLRVLIVDDHDLFRTGLRNLLEEQGVQIVGEAATGAEALQHVRREPHRAFEFAVDADHRGAIPPPAGP